jgi:EthD domain
MKGENMITFVLTMKRKAGLTKEQFREHYETSHVSLARKHVGHLFEDYRRHYVISSTFATGEGYTMQETSDGDYDVVTNIYFKDDAAVAEFFRILNLPDVKAAFQADEEKFVDRSKMYMNICDGVRTWVAADLAA